VIRLQSAVALVVALLATPLTVHPLPRGGGVMFAARLDDGLRARVAAAGTSAVIVSTVAGVEPARILDAEGGRLVRRLTHGFAADVANRRLQALARQPGVTAVSLDRPVAGMSMSPGDATGARWLREQVGLDGAGITVATIDSGVAGDHDDLPAATIAHWVDFVGNQGTPYDDYGHGTHVAGVIAGTGQDSNGARTGMAPGARLVVLKALDGAGHGRTSDVVAALDYAVANRARFGIRIVNLSVAAGVYESYQTDPLTQAARRAVDAGIVVVAAAGNYGAAPLGGPQWGGITAPGNAPWVLTVGAAGNDGRPARFSSRGPAAIDHTAKPDLIAPGLGVEAAADPASTLFALHPAARVWGSARTVSQPYLRLNGTSMAAAVVTGAVALMLQAEPTLTPNEVKAILQFTATPAAREETDAQGAGALNARGAVALAREFAVPSADTAANRRVAGDRGGWARHILWDDVTVSGDRLSRGGNAWAAGVTWGATTTPQGRPVSWGAFCAGLRAACAERRAADPARQLVFEATVGQREAVMPLALVDDRVGR
jgi:serine protease AprX